MNYGDVPLGVECALPPGFDCCAVNNLPPRLVLWLREASPTASEVLPVWPEVSAPGRAPG
jgi:hypothetical protein